jgi:hypothetical protein
MRETSMVPKVVIYLAAIGTEQLPIVSFQQDTLRMSRHCAFQLDERLFVVPIPELAEVTNCDLAHQKATNPLSS